MTQVLTPTFDYVAVVRHEPLEVKESDVLLNGLEFRTIRPSDVEEVCDFLIENFFPVEPMGTVLGLNAENECRPWIKQLVEHQIVEEVSFIVRNLADGEVAAVCLNDVERREEPNPELDVTMMTCLDEKPERNPCMNKIGAALGTLMEKHNLYEAFGLDSVVQLQFLSVSPHYGRRGLAKAIIGLVESRSKQLGHSLIYSEATGEFSARAFLQAGYFCVDQLEYSTFEIPETGEMPFKSMTGLHNCARLMIKHLK